MASSGQDSVNLPDQGLATLLEAAEEAQQHVGGGVLQGLTAAFGQPLQEAASWMRARVEQHIQVDPKEDFKVEMR